MLSVCLSSLVGSEYLWTLDRDSLLDVFVSLDMIAYAS